MGFHIVDPAGHRVAGGPSGGRRSVNKIKPSLFKPVEILFSKATVSAN